MSNCPTSEGKSGSWSSLGGTVPGSAAVRSNAPQTKNSRLRKINGVTHKAVGASAHHCKPRLNASKPLSAASPARLLASPAGARCTRRRKGDPTLMGRSAARPFAWRDDATGKPPGPPPRRPTTPWRGPVASPPVSASETATFESPATDWQTRLSVSAFSSQGSQRSKRANFSPVPLGVMAIAGGLLWVCPNRFRQISLVIAK